MENFIFCAVFTGNIKKPLSRNDLWVFLDDWNDIPMDIRPNLGVNKFVSCLKDLIRSDV